MHLMENTEFSDEHNKVIKTHTAYVMYEREEDADKAISSEDG